MSPFWYILTFISFFKLFMLLYCIISFGKFGPPYLGNTTAARAALPSPTSTCWVCSCFRKPPNSDMDYRTFNVRTWSYLCVRIHTGVGLTNNEFWIGKNSHICFIVLLTGFEPRVLGSRVRRSTNCDPPSPRITNTVGCHLRRLWYSSVIHVHASVIQRVRCQDVTVVVKGLIEG